MYIMRDDCVHGAGQEGFPADTVQGLFSAALELGWSISGANSITVPFSPCSTLNSGVFEVGQGSSLKFEGCEDDGSLNPARAQQQDIQQKHAGFSQHVSEELPRELFLFALFLPWALQRPPNA